MNTEPCIIARPCVIEAWKAATKLLVDEGDRFNLTVHITSPTALNEADVAPFCHRLVLPGSSKSVYDVANTIFPAAAALHSGDLDQFFAHYHRVYKRGQRRHRTAWGTYYLRLTAFGKGQKNQLRKIISVLTEWRSQPRAAFVIHLSSTDLDNPRVMGAPCWQYAQFIRSGDNTLSMTAVYRSHDYFQKALGNFVGLTRLLRFVCQHSKMTPGTLTCLSTYATLQSQKAKTRQLLEIS
jgi:thymidylate synthase